MSELKGPGSGRLSRGGWWEEDALWKFDTSTSTKIQQAVVACLALDIIIQRDTNVGKKDSR